MKSLGSSMRNLGKCFLKEDEHRLIVYDFEREELRLWVRDETGALSVMAYPISYNDLECFFKDLKEFHEKSSEV